MKPIKALGLVLIFEIGGRGSVADELAISSPTMIESPPLIQTSQESQLYGSVGASGTNGVFVWANPVGAGTTNLFLTRLDEAGQPVAAPPHFLASEFYLSAYPELYPAEGGFFLRYYDRTNAASTPRLLATRIDLDGNPAFAPVVISRNIFKEWDTASNGRALLLLVENYSTTIRLDYTILGWNGGIVSTGVLQGASGGHSFAAASDGIDFLAVWSASAPPYLRVTRFSGSNGSLSTTGIGTNKLVQTMAHGKNGYLVAGGASLMHLRDDGTLVVKTNITSIGTTLPQELIYPEGEGWILFTSDSSGALRTFRVTPTADGLSIDLDPYPQIQGVFSGTFSPPLTSIVAPFGPERFLLARNNGVSVLTKSGVTAAVKAFSYVQQKYSGVVASPFGYLTAWREPRELGYSIRGLRFAPDGSALDDHSFEIGTFSGGRTNPRSFVFDGKDYLVGWNVLDAPIRVARISPQGAPDVRLQSYSIDTGGYSFDLIAQKGELFASRGALTFEAPDVHIWKLGANGQAGPEVIVHGYGAVSDGANLFSIGLNDRSEVYKITIDPNAPNPEISSNIIGPVIDMHLAQLRHGFVAQLFDPQGNSSFVYFSNGQEWRGPAPKNVIRAFADTEERLLMLSLPPLNSRLSHIETSNFQTGERTSLEVVLGNVIDVHAAGSAADFLAIADSFNPELQYVAKFWITTANSPAFVQPRITQDSFTTTLELNPKRRYRIETSVDLVNWSLQQVLSGSASVNVTLPSDSQGFIRAILVPE